MNNPTELKMVEIYRREFPQAQLSSHERSFLAFIHIARAQGVGYGWMRQAIGVIWKEADPVGYIDDERLIEIHRRHQRQFDEGSHR